VEVWRVWAPKEQTGAPKAPEGLAFADEVAAAARAHASGMRSTRRHIAAIATLIRLRFAVKNQGHFAAKNHVGCFLCVPVVGIERVWAVLPHVGVTKSLVL